MFQIKTPNDLIETIDAYSSELFERIVKGYLEDGFYVENLSILIDKDLRFTYHADLRKLIITKEYAEIMDLIKK